MSGISFNATTSKLEHTTTSGFNNTAFTILALVRANGQGENSFGRVFGAPEDTTCYHLRHENAANTMTLFYQWTNGPAWTFPVTDSQWNAVAVSYDRSSTTNDAIARVNFSSVTVTQLSGTEPSGTATTPATGYCIGNNTAQNRTWDGGLMHVMYYPTALSAANMDQALRYPGSVQGNGAFWWPMLNGSYVNVFTSDGTKWSAGTNPTATALSDFTTNSPSPWPRRFVTNGSQEASRNSHTRSGHLLVA